MLSMRFLVSSTTLALVAATAVAGFTGESAGADASAPARAAAVRPSAYQVLLTFDHKESLKPHTRVRDASGHRHAGTVLVRAGGRLQRDSGFVRRGADFPGAC